MKSKIVICPGVHDSTLTEDFLRGSQLRTRESENLLVFPHCQAAPYSGREIIFFLENHLGLPKNSPPLIFLAFSAGVAGAISTAWYWQQQGGEVKAFFAWDGWGVPLAGSFPLYRLSHDYFTHWSSALLGTGEESFYADPAVGHLTLWRSPHTTQGWWLNSGGRSSCTAAEFLNNLLER